MTRLVGVGLSGLCFGEGSANSTVAVSMKATGCMLDVSRQSGIACACALDKIASASNKASMTGEPKNEIAVAMARMRAAKLTPERRREIALNAANAPRPNAKNAGRPKKKVEV